MAWRDDAPTWIEAAWDEEEDKKRRKIYKPPPLSVTIERFRNYRKKKSNDRNEDRGQ